LSAEDLAADERVFLTHPTYDRYQNFPERTSYRDKQSESSAYTLIWWRYAPRRAARPVRPRCLRDTRDADRPEVVPADFLESALLRESGFRHAFFTRRGGVSEGPYATLNFSRAVGDAPERVMQNLALAGETLGLPPDRIYFLSQVHGNGAVRLNGDEPAEAVLEREGDAVVSRAPGVACGVRTADCVPILVADRRSGAVGAIHAGWRGVVRGVIEAGVNALRDAAGGEPELVAALGPHIRLWSFEVDEDVAEELAAASPVPCVVRRPGMKPHVRLDNIVRAKLTAAGVAAEHIDDVGGCTVTEAERFFSFRRDGKVGGRHLAAIATRPT
jgi:YfiH family protein